MDTSQNPKQVLCVGDMVADIFASPLSWLPEPDELVLTEIIAVYPGGNALNTAVALHCLGEQIVVASPAFCEAGILSTRSNSRVPSAPLGLRLLDIRTGYRLSQQ